MFYVLALALLAGTEVAFLYLRLSLRLIDKSRLALRHSRPETVETYPRTSPLGVGLERFRQTAYFISKNPASNVDGSGPLALRLIGSTGEGQSSGIKLTAVYVKPGALQRLLLLQMGVKPEPKISESAKNEPSSEEVCGALDPTYRCCVRWYCRPSRHTIIPRAVQECLQTVETSLKTRGMSSTAQPGSTSSRHPTGQ